MKINEIMAIDVENLREKQHEAMKKHVLNVLSEVSKAVKNGAYDEVRKLLAFSPAGDGYGDDNYYINFGYDAKNFDIAEAISILESLER